MILFYPEIHGLGFRGLLDDARPYAAFGVRGNRPTKFWRIIGLSTIMSTLVGVTTIVTFLIYLVTPSHDPLSIGRNSDLRVARKL